MYSGNNLETMKRIFQTNVMMTVAVLLMAVMPGQRLAAQQAGGKQGGVMQLTLEGRWTWRAVSQLMRRWR